MQFLFFRSSISWFLTWGRTWGLLLRCQRGTPKRRRYRCSSRTTILKKSPIHLYVDDLLLSLFLSLSIHHHIFIRWFWRTVSSQIWTWSYSGWISSTKNVSSRFRRLPQQQQGAASAASAASAAALSMLLLTRQDQIAESLSLEPTVIAYTRTPRCKLVW